MFLAPRKEIDNRTMMRLLFATMWYIMSAPIALNTIKTHPGNAAREGII
jgi:hypothetical protein